MSAGGGLPGVSAELADQISQETYIWGYPLVLMEVTRRVMTNYETPTDVPGQAPLNQFNHAKTFPPASFRAVVRPNFDTLYSVAWLDLVPEPLVMTLPRTDRYHVIQMMDAWSEVFAAPGTRMTGGAGGDYLIAGPAWTAEAPPGVTVLRSPTDIAWIAGRIQTNGPGDYDFVHALQAQISLTPLSRRGQAYTPPAGTVDPAVDMTTPPMAVVDAMTGKAFFTALMAALKRNLPHIHDQATVARMRRLGLEPGQSLDLEALPAAVQQAVSSAPGNAQKTIRTRASHLGTPVNGWRAQTGSIGYYGGDYTLRAAVALIGLGANRPEDAFYPIGDTDNEGNPFTGANRYLIHFPNGQTPPVDAFWSITLYDEHGFPVANPIGRHAIGDRDKLTCNDDGSLDIHIQHDHPGPGKEANWLPAPEGVFTLAMRCYSPRPEAISGAWAPPPVRRQQ